MNNVQSLDKNRRGRGRPKSEYLQFVRALYHELHSRSAIHDQLTKAHMSVACHRLGLTDDGRDVTTKRRMSTKLVEVSRLFSGDFWETADGEKWLRTNWTQLVELSVDDVKAWVRQNNPRAKAA